MLLHTTVCLLFFFFHIHYDIFCFPQGQDLPSHLAVIVSQSSWCMYTQPNEEIDRANVQNANALLPCGLSSKSAYSCNYPISQSGCFTAVHKIWWSGLSVNVPSVCGRVRGGRGGFKDWRISSLCFVLNCCSGEVFDWQQVGRCLCPGSGGGEIVFSWWKSCLWCCIGIFKIVRQSYFWKWAV